jgi:hypothetical protein
MNIKSATVVLFEDDIRVDWIYTLIKKKTKFSSHIRKLIGMGCKVLYD